MTKTRHIPVLIAHIQVAVEYDPQNLESLTTLNAQIREQARKLTGYRDIELRIGKIPAPVEPVDTVVVPMVDDAVIQENLNKVARNGMGLDEDALNIPSFMARK